MVDYSHPPRARGRVIRAFQKLEDHWIGDLIGGVCLALSIAALILIAGVLS